MLFWWFWTIFDLKLRLLAENDVGCSAPDLKRRLGVEFPEGTFLSQNTGILEIPWDGQSSRGPK